jgi:hypothetical protein
MFSLGGALSSVNDSVGSGLGLLLLGYIMFSLFKSISLSSTFSACLINFFFECSNCFLFFFVRLSRFLNSNFNLLLGDLGEGFLFGDVALGDSLFLFELLELLLLGLDDCLLGSVLFVGGGILNGGL